MASYPGTSLHHRHSTHFAITGWEISLLANCFGKLWPKFKIQLRREPMQAEWDLGLGFRVKGVCTIMPVSASTIPLHGEDKNKACWPES